MLVGNNSFYAIYFLVDPRDLEPFYVGRTKQAAETRLTQHLRQPKGECGDGCVSGRTLRKTSAK